MTAKTKIHKKIIIAIVMVPVVCVILMGALFAYYYVKEEFTDTPTEQKVEVRPLTEQEKAFVGVWEAEDGSLIAIRARGSYEAKSFALDGIYDAPFGPDGSKRDWCKITRDSEGTTIEQNGEFIVISDKYLCPDINYPIEANQFVETEERLEYDPTTHTITHISRHQTVDGEMLEVVKTFHPTEIDPTDESIDWEWYYDIHPNRKP